MATHSTAARSAIDHLISAAESIAHLIDERCA